MNIIQIIVLLILIVIFLICKLIGEIITIKKIDLLNRASVARVPRKFTYHKKK